MFYVMVMLSYTTFQSLQHLQYSNPEPQPELQGVRLYKCMYVCMYVYAMINKKFVRGN